MIIGRVLENERKVKFEEDITCTNCGKKVPGGLQTGESYYKTQEFQEMIDPPQNVLISRHSFREFPEIKINIRKGQNEYTLIGRGFKPFQEQYAELEDYPISKLRLIALYIPYGIILTLTFLISFF